MNSMLFLFGLLPLLVFVLVDSFAGLRAGLVSALIFALLEACYSLYTFGEVDSLTLGSFLLVAVFGAISFWQKKSIYFKLQPFFVGVFSGVFLIVMQLMEKPVFLIAAKKYKNLFPDEMQKLLAEPFFLEILEKASWHTGSWLLVHAFCVAYAAFYLSKWWWLIIRGLGLYLSLFLATLTARFL